MKKCKTCHKALDYTNFHTSANHKDGYRSECKVCVSVYWKLKNANNRDNYKVYCLKHKITKDIIYIGCTSQSLMKRLRDHFGDKKVERGSVHIEIIMDNLTEAQGLSLEAMLIEQYNPSLNIYDGYKIHSGKDSQPKFVTDKFKQAIKESNSRPIICVNTGKTYDSMSKAALELGLTVPKICLVCQGKRPHTKGYKFSYL